MSFCILFSSCNDRPLDGVTFRATSPRRGTSSEMTFLEGSGDVVRLSSIHVFFCFFTLLYKMNEIK